MITGNEPVTGLINHQAFNGKSVTWIEGTPGLTIRQHYAGLAMQGFLANHYHANDMDKLKDMDVNEQVQRYVTGSVMIADALINELNKPNQP